MSDIDQLLNEVRELTSKVTALVKRQERAIAKLEQGEEWKQGTHEPRYEPRGDDNEE
jgi:hypothetical protein